MRDFEYVLVSTSSEVISLLSDTGKKIKILNGGTDLITQLSDGRVEPDIVIDIKAIPEVNEIRIDDKGIFIGSAVTCLTLCRNAEIKKTYSGLFDAFSLIGGVQIQGRATIGGNLCNASPAADSIPALIAHNAECIIAGPNGNQTVPVSEFCIAPGKTVLKNNEILVGIHVPKPNGVYASAYERFIPRNEMDIAVVGVGSFLSINKDGAIQKARLALGAVGPTPLYVTKAEELLKGISIFDEHLNTVLDKVSQVAQKTSIPITDMRGSADQRKHLVQVLTRRTLLTCVERIKITLGA